VKIADLCLAELSPFQSNQENIGPFWQNHCGLAVVAHSTAAFPTTWVLPFACQVQAGTAVGSSHFCRFQPNDSVDGISSDETGLVGSDPILESLDQKTRKVQTAHIFKVPDYRSTVDGRWRQCGQGVMVGMCPDFYVHPLSVFFCFASY